MAEVSQTYCVLPFIQMSVDTTGTVKNCCVAEGNHTKSERDYWNVGRDDLGAIWNSEYFEGLRAQFLRGERPAACQRCWSDERIGVESKRQRDNQVWKKYYGIRERLESPAWLDLRLGNLCNLKCRICHPHASGKFAKESAEIFGGVDLDLLQNDTAWANDPENPFWKTLDRWLPTVEHFDIYGGEPFLSKSHFALLERSKTLGCSKRQTIHYNTNGTIFPEKMAKEVWPHFKSVNVMFSIDGVGKQFEYQRHPAVWEQVEENVRKFKKYRYLNLNVCFTVNVMNIWNFPEFFDWTRKMKLTFWINYLHTPEHFRAQLFSSPAKRLIEARLRKVPMHWQYQRQIEALIGFLWDRSFSDSDREVLNTQLEIYDRKRGEKFHEVFPEVQYLLSMSEREIRLDAHP